MTLLPVPIRLTEEDAEAAWPGLQGAVIYKPVNGFVHYLVGDDGSVWSKASGLWRKVSTRPDAYGYLIVKLCLSGRVVPTKVHILVALTFLGPRPGRLEVCHNDGNRNNCALSNLRYDTHKGNHADRRAHGTSNAGERNGMAKMSADTVRELRRRYQAGEPKPELMAAFGLSRRAVERIVTGARWGHVK